VAVATTEVAEMTEEEEDGTIIITLLTAATG
jgi:hypothetical protein